MSKRSPPSEGPSGSATGTSRAAPAMASGFASGSVCMRCNKVGHFARECSEPVRCDFCGEVGHVQRMCEKKLTESECSRCKMKGHYARDCPNLPEQQRECYRCKEPGHLARDCPQASDSAERCHACGEGGHFARECPRGHSMGFRGRYLGMREDVGQFQLLSKTSESAFQSGFMKASGGLRAPPAQSSDSQASAPPPPPLGNPPGAVLKPAAKKARTDGELQVKIVKPKKQKAKAANPSSSQAPPPSIVPAKKVPGAHVHRVPRARFLPPHSASSF
ncbi:hypothetical protein CYMTET_29559 [Cymbomonas tetramitiformis]|uniref:CCHC-type domain-containing protein n=1 Tax=Cymbomonas tetramitiformis TaxID=36881 RepID=A0AAE0FKL6_9CHLO|nr:hypothetical protein CYMTET_29559 [Cymbomonas tetramitiformis]